MNQRRGHVVASNPLAVLVACWAAVSTWTGLNLGVYCYFYETGSSEHCNGAWKWPEFSGPLRKETETDLSLLYFLFLLGLLCVSVLQEWSPRLHRTLRLPLSSLAHGRDLEDCCRAPGAWWSSFCVGDFLFGAVTLALVAYYAAFFWSYNVTELCDGDSEANDDDDDLDDDAQDPYCLLKAFAVSAGNLNNLLLALVQVLVPALRAEPGSTDGVPENSRNIGKI